MKAAHALHSQDLAIPQQAGRLLEDRQIRGVCTGISRMRHGTGVAAQLHTDPRAAPWAGDVLGVEPAVGRVGIFALALRAGREIDHRGSLAVERCRSLEAEPRTAVRAARQREAVAAVVVRINSARHAGQTARSGVITTRTWGIAPAPAASLTRSLGRMENPTQPSPGSSSTVIA